MEQHLTSKNNYDTLKLTDTEKRFLAFCKEFGWGKLEVTIKDGQPVLSRELVHDYKHD